MEQDTFFSAIADGKLATVKECLRQGVSPNYIQDGRPSLVEASVSFAGSEVQAQLVQLLLENGASVNAVDKLTGATALHFASQQNNFSCVNTLLLYGADVHAVDKHGNSPLFRAVLASRGNPMLVKRLITAGADPSKQNLHGVSPKSLAKECGLDDILTVFAREHK